jgi:hypothetical protein
MTFCATHQCAGTCPSYLRQRAVKSPGGLGGWRRQAAPQVGVGRCPRS